MGAENGGERPLVAAAVAVSAAATAAPVVLPSAAAAGRRSTTDRDGEEGLASASSQGEATAAVAGWLTASAAAARRSGSADADNTSVPGATLVGATSVVAGTVAAAATAHDANGGGTVDRRPVLVPAPQHLAKAVKLSDRSSRRTVRILYSSRSFVTYCSAERGRVLRFHIGQDPSTVRGARANRIHNAIGEQLVDDINGRLGSDHWSSLSGTRAYEVLSSMAGDLADASCFLLHLLVPRYTPPLHPPGTPPVDMNTPPVPSPTYPQTSGTPSSTPCVAHGGTPTHRQQRTSRDRRKQPNTIAHSMNTTVRQYRTSIDKRKQPNTIAYSMSTTLRQQRTSSDERKQPSTIARSMSTTLRPP